MLRELRDVVVFSWFRSVAKTRGGLNRNTVSNDVPEMLPLEEKLSTSLIGQLIQVVGRRNPRESRVISAHTLSRENRQSTREIPRANICLGNDELRLLDSMCWSASLI